MASAHRHQWLPGSLVVRSRVPSTVSRITEIQVGFLSHEDAAAYSATTELLVGTKAIGFCRARVIGGTVFRGRRRLGT